MTDDQQLISKTKNKVKYIIVDLLINDEVPSDAELNAIQELKENDI